MSNTSKVDFSLLPRRQKKLIGHERQWARLRDNFDEKKLHSAIILAGIEGVGKATFAYQFAKFILVDNSSDKDNHLFYEGLFLENCHPNLMIIERKYDEDGILAKEIKIDDVRPLQEFTQKSSALPGWRVVIIDGLEYLNHNAANAILKILEEPPRDLVFLCVSHRPKHILPTIRSRCQLLPFSAPSFEVLRNENSFFNTVTALEIDFSGGSIGTLVNLKKPDRDPLDQQVKLLAGFCADALKGKFSVLQTFLGSLKKNDERVSVFGEVIQWMVRRIILLQSGCNPTLGKIDENLLEIGMKYPLSKTESQGKHWLKVQETLENFILDAKQAHLDQTHFLQGIFGIIANPNLFR